MLLLSPIQILEVQRVIKMIKAGLLSDNRLIMVSCATKSNNADTEDLFTNGDYIALYNMAFSASIKVGDLPPRDRIVKRIEAHKKEYNHGKVAETFLRYHNEIKISDKSLDQFEALFKEVNATIEK